MASGLLTIYPSRPGEWYLRMITKMKDIPWVGTPVCGTVIVLVKTENIIYFPLKDQTDIFRIGSGRGRQNPEGPSSARSDEGELRYPDPAILDDGDGNYYIFRWFYGAVSATL